LSVRHLSLPLLDSSLEKLPRKKAFHGERFGAQHITRLRACK